MSSKSSVDWYNRRHQILNALAISPLDAGQLTRLSETFCDPFTDRLYALRAMARMVKEKLAIEYVFPDRSKYWKPSRDGYRFLYGPDKALPKKTAFNAVSPSLERHTRRLGDLLVSFFIAAKRQGYDVVEVFGDHQVKLVQGERSKTPDQGITLRKKVSGRNRYYTLLVELDCGTEWGYTAQSEDSINRMIQFYLDHHGSVDDDYRVLVLFDKPTQRLSHFLGRVEQLNADPRRQPIKVGLLDDVLRHSEFLELPILRDPKSDAVPMIGAAPSEPIQNPTLLMDEALAA